VTLLYSPEFHEPKESGCTPATATPDRTPMTGWTGDSRRSAIRIARRIAADTESVLTGAITSLGAPAIGANAELDPKFTKKEADSIGMARGYSSLFSTLFPVSLAKPIARLHSRLLVYSLLLLALPAFVSSAHAQSASTWNKRGQAAELRQDYDTAYEDYRRAHQKNPKDMRYEARVDRMRFQASAQHVDRGRVLRQSGDVAGALNEFTRALQIDPSDDAAAQEIQITQHPQAQSAPAPTGPLASGIPPPASGPAAMLRELGEVSSPVVLKPLSTDMITMHLGPTDAKDIYTAIGKASGLNVLFDPVYASKRIPVDLNSVSYTDALRIVGLLSSSFYKPVTADTIFVAENSPAKHTDFDDQAVQTFYLTNVSQPNDGNEIQNAVRNTLPPDIKVQFVASQNALILRGTTDELMLAQKLLNDLDRPKAEVVVDVAILEVNRDKIRSLGITLPQSFGLTPQASSTASTTSTTTTSTTSTTSALTLNTLGNLNATNFAVTLGGGTLNALLTDSDTRVLQNPSIRSTDGQRSQLKIGSKIPIATGSYSAGAATGITAGIGVQTQFQYTDVGVVIDMTPAVHLDREISLKLKVDVTSQTGTVTESGLSEPILSQRTSDGTIQLKDGEPCLLAGILTKEDNHTNSGTPGLAEIPILKYLFGSQYKEVAQDEVVFILIPHIVRESVVTRQNTRPIDTGTSHTIELRRDPAADTPTPVSGNDLPAKPASQPGSATSAASAAAAMVHPIGQQAAPLVPPAAGGLQPVSMMVLPADSSHATGSTFQVAVLAVNAHDLYAVPLQLQFNSKVLELVNVDAGGLLGGDNQPVALVHRDEGNGMVTINASRPPGVAGVSGQGDVCTLTFRAVAAGDSTITLVKVGAQNSNLMTIPTVGASAVVHVK
jgi:general secretion pathway protein D